MAISKSDPIAIIGGGAFGLSTALELSSKGYINVTVFEKDEDIPSRWSAANDLNKIMRAEYEDGFYTNLAVVGSPLHPEQYYKGLIIRVIADVPKGSYLRLADSPICALLPPSRLSELCLWCCTTESSRYDAQIPRGCREAPGNGAFLPSHLRASRCT
jgi:hypothetical protein